MLILHLWRLMRAGAAKAARMRIGLRSAIRRRRRRRAARPALSRLDRRTLGDIGFGPGAIVSLARDIGFERLRHPPHV